MTDARLPLPSSNTDGELERLSNILAKLWGRILVRGMNVRLRTIVLLNIASIVERADEQVLPAVYYFIGRSLQATPTQLGMLTLCRAMVQALSSPISGVLGDKYDRTHIVAAGCFLWGVMTSVIGASRSIGQAMVSCGFNGFGLALVIPCVQSLTADYNTSETRGRAFGFMFFTGAVGGMLGGFFATNVGATHPYGIEGWRFAFHLMALVSLVTAALILYFASDPRQRVVISPLLLGDPRLAPQYGAVSTVDDGGIGVGRGQGRSLMPLAGGSSSKAKPHLQFQRRGSVRGGGAVSRVQEVMKDVGSVLKIRTFQIIVLQGIVGSTPWNAMVFFTVWLQLLGFSNFKASLLMAIFAFGSSLGHLIGGWIGDHLATLYPNSGRVYTAQASVVLGLPLSLLLLWGLPAAEGHVQNSTLSFGTVLFAMGCLITWCGPTNSAMFSDIVPEQLRSTVYAFDRSFEGAVAACAAPLVGLMAEHIFGFSGAVASDEATNRRNAAALGNSLLVCLVVPWVLCLCFYTGLHWSYPRDKVLVAGLSKRLSMAGDKESSEGSYMRRGVSEPNLGPHVQLAV